MNNLEHLRLQGSVLSSLDTVSKAKHDEDAKTQSEAVKKLTALVANNPAALDILRGGPREEMRDHLPIQSTRPVRNRTVVAR